jgi:hypothetical protein
MSKWDGKWTSENERAEKYFDEEICICEGPWTEKQMCQYIILYYKKKINV